MIDMKHSLAALMNRRAELTGTVVNLEEIHIERVADELDLLQQSSERELAIARIHRDTETVRKIDAALQRIEEGLYGVCEDCEQDIAPARLKAIPWAALCVRCQEKADNRSHLSTLKEAA